MYIYIDQWLFIFFNIFFIIMECILSQQYLSYSPAVRWAGLGLSPYPLKASVSEAAKKRLRRDACPQHNSYTHIEKVTNRNMYYITLILEIYTTHKENNSYKIDT